MAKFAHTLGGLLALATTLMMSACSSEQVYNTGQAWRRNECFKLQDSEARARCLKQADQPYDAYKNEVDTTVKPAK